jgi:hypothetical protein
MNKNISIVVSVLVIVALAAFAWNYSLKHKGAPEDTVKVLDKASSGDSTEEIDASLNSIDLDGGANADLQGLDADLKNL